MFERISNSWELVKASWAVLRADKELILFPFVSMIGVILVMIAFAVPSLLAGLFDQAASDGNFNIVSYIVAFLFYVVMYTVIIFFNSALVGAAMIRLRGGDPTVSDGFRIAYSHMGVIVQYAVISATVGVILRFIRERAGFLGGVIAWLGSMAWNIATFLVVPVLVVEDVSPIDAIKRSAGLLRQTWGEQIVGNFSIGLIFGLVTLAAIVVIGLPLILLALSIGSVVAMVAAIAIIVFVVVGIQLIASTLNGIYVAALYRYAVEDDAGTHFSPELIQGAFRQK
jgi:hypothetical protein